MPKDKDFWKSVGCRADTIYIPEDDKQLRMNNRVTLGRHLVKVCDDPSTPNHVIAMMSQRRNIILPDYWEAKMVLGEAERKNKTSIVNLLTECLDLGQLHNATRFKLAHEAETDEEIIHLEAKLYVVAFLAEALMRKAKHKLGIE